jgi:hypothetical protein
VTTGTGNEDTLLLLVMISKSDSLCSQLCLQVLDPAQCLSQPVLRRSCLSLRCLATLGEHTMEVHAVEASVLQN